MGARVSSQGTELSLSELSLTDYPTSLAQLVGGQEHPQCASYFTLLCMEPPLRWGWVGVGLHSGHLDSSILAAFFLILPVLFLLRSWFQA